MQIQTDLCLVAGTNPPHNNSTTEEARPRAAGPQQEDCKLYRDTEQSLLKRWLLLKPDLFHLNSIPSCLTESCSPRVHTYFKNTGIFTARDGQLLQERRSKHLHAWEKKTFFKWWSFEFDWDRSLGDPLQNNRKSKRHMGKYDTKCFNACEWLAK